MKTNVLVELNFNEIISESVAQTQTGAELLDKYKAYLMANECSHGLVNNFIREASACQYDNGVNKVFSEVVDFINENKTLWQLATVCENINMGTYSRDYLTRNAVKKVEPFLELNEGELVKNIKAGALKGVMYCEAFKNVIKQLYNEQPVVESKMNYIKQTPVSIVENVGDGYCFEILGKLFKIDDEKNVTEAQWNEVSNTFKTITNLLESNVCKIDSDTIEVSVGNAKYSISNANEIVKENKEGSKQVFTVEALRENNRLVLMTANPRYKNEFARVLESIALVAEHFNSIVNLDNSAIYSTKNDKFLVIESGDTIYSTLLKSNHSTPWTINENAVDAIEYIKRITHVQLNEEYAQNVADAMESLAEIDKEMIKESQHESTVSEYKSRIEALVEKFKNDPVKLAVVNKLAQEISEQ